VLSCYSDLPPPLIGKIGRSKEESLTIWSPIRRTAPGSKRQQPSRPWVVELHAPPVSRLAGCSAGALGLEAEISQRRWRSEQQTCSQQKDGLWAANPAWAFSCRSPYHWFRNNHDNICVSHPSKKKKTFLRDSDAEQTCISYEFSPLNGNVLRPKKKLL